MVGLNKGAAYINGFNIGRFVYGVSVFYLFGSIFFTKDVIWYLPRIIIGTGSFVLPFFCFSGFSTSHVVCDRPNELS